MDADENVTVQYSWLQNTMISSGNAISLCLSEKRRWIWIKWISFPPSWKGLETNSASDVRCVPLWLNNVRLSLASSVQSVFWKRCSILFSEISSFLHFERTNLMRIKVTRTQWDTSDATGRARLKPFPRWRKWNSFCLNSNKTDNN